MLLSFQNNRLEAAKTAIAAATKIKVKQTDMIMNVRNFH